MDNTYNKIADELEKIQARLNPPIGISCIRSIVYYIRMGYIEDAKQIARNDGDKMWQYKGLHDFVYKSLGI